jgi:hypothetical protein
MVTGMPLLQSGTAALWVGDVIPGAPTRTLTLDQYLKHPVLFLDGTHYTVLDVITACANHFGGVHLGDPSKDTDTQAALRRMNNIMGVGGSPAVFSSLRAIAKTTLVALKELRASTT